MELKITVTPQKILEAKKHTCNVCGYYGIWTKDWGYYEKVVGTKYNKGEAQFRICSDECRKKEKEEGLVDAWRNKKEKTIICKECKKPKKYYAKGLCQTCYNKAIIDRIASKNDYRVI